MLFGPEQMSLTSLTIVDSDRCCFVSFFLTEFGCKYRNQKSATLSSSKFYRLRIYQESVLVDKKAAIIY